MTTSGAEPATRCGYAALVGRANVGKSTLLNRLVGARIAAVASKPQTTRHNVCGILTDAASQIVFVDTPGYQLREPRLLNSALNRNVARAFADVDVAILVVHGDTWGEEEQRIIERLRAASTPCVLCINKVDTVRDKRALLPLMARLEERFAFKALVPVSARRGDNLEALTEEVRVCLPRGPFLFPEDQLSDRDERFRASELIREALVRHLREELPHSVYVEIERFAEAATQIEIAATVWVSRAGHKPIVIGARGAGLKTVGTHARHSLEAALGRKVMLRLWVKVDPDWQDDPRAVAHLGD